MRRLAILALLLGTTANAAWTTEILVLNSAAVTVANQSSQHGMIIQNRGPNSIFCADNGETPVLNKSLEIKSGGSLSFAGNSTVVKCIAATADQVTGAATIVMAVP